jgi:hypothetical protein
MALDSVAPVIFYMAVVRVQPKAIKLPSVYKTWPAPPHANNLLRHFRALNKASNFTRAELLIKT